MTIKRRFVATFDVEGDPDQFDALAADLSDARAGMATWMEAAMPDLGDVTVYSSLTDLVYDEGDTVAPIVQSRDATPAEVSGILAAAEGDPDGRTGFRWITLYDGTLMLAILPQGDTYEIATQAAHRLGQDAPADFNASPLACDPDNFWKDDKTGEVIDASTGKRCMRYIVDGIDADGSDVWQGGPDTFPPFCIFDVDGQAINKWAGFFADRDAAQDVADSLNRRELISA